MLGLPTYQQKSSVGYTPAAPSAFLTPAAQAANNAPMYWPGVTYPWMPWLPGWSGYAVPAPIDPLNAATRICLGNQCWPYARMSAADAEQIVKTLMQNSWPLEYVGLAAVALYDRGYWTQARAVLRMYGGMYGVDAVARQIQRVYDDTTGPSVVPTGAPDYGTLALDYQ